MTDDAVLQFLRDASSIEHLYLMGGFAEDALLDGGITRKRGDIDFLVPERHWSSTRTELEGIGLRDFAPLLAGPDGKPPAFVSRDLGFEVEVWLATLDGEDYGLVLPGGSGFFQLRLPSDTFDFTGASLDGTHVRTVSPRALALLRATSAATRGDEESRAADRRVVQRIVEKLLPSRGAESVIPDITELHAP